jgi:hypothetical protein
MTTTGQPFGYRRDAPNQKIEFQKRQEAWEKWLEKHTETDARQKAFADVTCYDIIDAKCAVPLGLIYSFIKKGKDCDIVIRNLAGLEGASEKIVRDFVIQFDKALKSEVIVQQVSPSVVADQAEYFRFFKRLGQGGTRLSDDELTYSIIKHQYPTIHDRMREIMKDCGRLAGEVNLVLAALRVAKTVAPWTDAKEWEVISRPNPAFVVGMKEKPQALDEFLAMVLQEDARPPKLQSALKNVREALTQGPRGLPAMLLARLPHELIDVLILFAVKLGVYEHWPENIHQTLCAFVLHWLVFVRDNGAAAWRAFQHAKDREWVFDETSIRKLVDEYETNEVASFIPRRAALCDLRNEVKERDHILPAWSERFIAADRNAEHKPGEALRLLSTNRELCMRALMWLQRTYIGREWPSYDPTSDRDEDLPIDLDHIVPRAVFGFNWLNAGKLVSAKVISDKSDNFRWRRSIVGDSLGNFRWLDASDNRRKSDGPYEPLPDTEDDFVSNPEAWNKVISISTNCRGWSEESIKAFQGLIDSRTLDLYEKILVESGIEKILPVDPETNTSPMQQRYVT